MALLEVGHFEEENSSCTRQNSLQQSVTQEARMETTDSLTGSLVPACRNVAPSGQVRFTEPWV